MQSICDWIIKLNDHGPEVLIDRHGGGTIHLPAAVHWQALATAIENGTIPAVHDVVRWRVIDMRQWLWDGHAPRVSKQTLSRALRAMGYRRLSAQPRRHAQAAGAIAAFKRLPARLDAIRRAQGVTAGGIEVWFADEARIQKKNKGPPALGPPGDPPVGTAGLGHGVDLHLRRDLPGHEYYSRPGAALVQHRRPGAARGGDRQACHAGQTLCAVGRLGRMARSQTACSAAQDHDRPAAGQMPGVKPGRERLVIHAQQLPLEQCARVLHCRRGPLLRRLEPSDRPTLARHVHRTTLVGLRI